MTVCQGRVCQNSSCVGCASCKTKSYKSFLDAQERKMQKCVSLEIQTKQQKGQQKGSLHRVVTCIEEALLGVPLSWSEDIFNEAELCVLNLE